MKKLLFTSIGTTALVSLFAQSAGKFPPEPFNGMQVSYSIIGATISKYSDVPGFTWTRSLVITGIQKGGTLEVSGTVQAGGFGCTVIVSVSAGSESSEGTYEVKPEKPVYFKQKVDISKDANVAGISINMNGSYKMGGGHRGVIVSGNWSERWGAENPPPNPNQYKPKPSPVAILKEVLKKYSDESRIPRGLVSNGPDNNKLWWFDNKYDEFTCGGYQSKVLTLLDNMKYGNNPAEKEWLNDLDYGPIEANCGVTPGGHHAVVIFPKGTDWKETGTVLDPWPEQRPKSYTMEEWKKLFPQGVKPDGYYKGQYPITGGTGSDPRSTELTPAESSWYKTVGKNKQQQYSAIKDATERKRRIKFDYSNRNYDTRTIADCPLDIYLVDRLGRISGFPEGKLQTDIPDVSVNRVPLSDGTYWTELAYPGNKGYKVVLKGTGNGAARVYSGLNMNADPLNRFIYRYNLTVNNADVFGLNQSKGGNEMISLNRTFVSGEKILPVRLTSPDLKVTSTEVIAEEKIFDNGNIYGVSNGPTAPTKFSLRGQTLITRIETYHYFNHGVQPGTISLVSENGQKFGPWKAAGSPGQGGVPNAYWIVKPNEVLPPGTYTVIDSDPGTWSTNTQSGGRGHTKIMAGKKTLMEGFFISSQCSFPCMLVLHDGLKVIIAS